MMQANRAPLEFACKQPGRLERVHDLQGTLIAALRRPLALHIPPDAKRRLEDAARKLEASGLSPEVLEWVHKRLAGLIDENYPQRMLAQGAERIPGVGPKTAAALTRKEICSMEDLLFFLRFRLPSLH